LDKGHGNNNIGTTVIETVKTYKEGTLRSSLVDSETKNIIWKDTASNKIYKSKNESKAIAKFVDAVFAKFPKNR
jgi:hypothetical protein